MKKKIKKNRGDQLNHRPLEKVDHFVEKMKYRMLTDLSSNLNNESVDGNTNINQKNVKDEMIKDKIKHNYEILKALEEEILEEESDRQKINTDMEEQDIHEFTAKMAKVQEIKNN